MFKKKYYNLKAKLDLGNTGQVSQVEKENLRKDLYLYFVSFMPYATGIVRSHFMNLWHSSFMDCEEVVIISTVANWFL